MVKQSIIICLISFVLSVGLGRIILPILRRLKANQSERAEGPKSHLKKAGTPTMGGIIFILAFLLVAGYNAFIFPTIIPVVISTIGFGLVGFLDDYLKVVKRNTKGLKPLHKFALQLIVTAILLLYIKYFTSISFDMIIPFSGLFSPDAGDIYVNFGIFTVPFLMVTILGTVNGANFTDGLDGLLSTVSIIICIFMTAAAMKLGVNVTLAEASMAGALLGFLVYNWHPAKVFMGDTGSLAIGGFVAASMLVMKMPIVILMVAFIYLAEVLSVILQVGYFKLTHGKRIFRMAPIHHHFELGGWSEIQVVTAFSALTALLCLIAYVVI
ncbi:MAG: phospho-N-acetylmuramoyl-pentapeptide-transferase [Lachnospiraceae bacterium]|nr:phospho-N-acetylmuramoyl-pentapeptide-transferase [Lachnospiraceae bacterium]